MSESVGAPCRIHDLRHTHASWLIAAGEHPIAIQTRLGHSSIQVTIDRYGHLISTPSPNPFVAQAWPQATQPTELQTRRNPR